MPTDPTTHVVYMSINRPLTIWGLDRRLFMLALLMGAASFNFFGSLLGGLLMFGMLYGAARLCLARDPQWLRIVFNASRDRATYDAAKFEPIHVRRMTRHDPHTHDRR